MKDTNKQYTKYIPQFKNSCIFKISASALAFLFILLFVFLPIFQLTFGTIVISRFSLFDLIKNIMDMFLNSSIGFEYFLAYYCYLFAILYGLVALIMIIIEIIKSIGRIFDLDSYALETYDQIKARVDLKENKKRRPFNPASMLWGTLIFFVMGVFMEKLFSTGFGMEEASSQLFSIFDIIFDKNGYSIPMVCILAIVFIGTIVLTSFSNSYEKKLSLAIIKEDYGIQDTAFASTNEKHEKNTFEQIRELKELLDMGAITQEEFEAQKNQLLNQNTVDSESDA